MKARDYLSILVWILSIGIAESAGQTPTSLTLKEAQDIATANHPLVGAAESTLKASHQFTTEVRSAYYPNIFGSATSVGTAPGSRVAAGALNNPSIFNRYANGITINQLVTDLGRTGSLTKSSRLREQSEGQNVVATRAQVLLEVDQAYYNALRAQALLRVAQDTVGARQTVLDKVSALEKSGLKSGLDVNFAQVNVEQARLLLLRAQNEVDASFTELATAMGYRDQRTFALVEEPLPPAMPQDLATLITGAVNNRPDLLSLRFNRDAAFKFADAEKGLRLPTISTIATFGWVPFHDQNIQNHYEAIGLNINFPIFNGRLFDARWRAAEFKAEAAEKTVTEMENRITRDTRLAWLNANTAFKSIEVTAHLLDQASQAFELAQARYNLGLSSIVELTQAELFKTEAEIANTNAKYEYQTRRAELDYSVGKLR